MYQGYNISDAIKQAKRAKRGKKDAKKTVSGISRQRISRILNGESRATIAEIESICAAFGLQLVAVSADEYAKMQRFMAFLAEIDAKTHEKGE